MTPIKLPNRTLISVLGERAGILRRMGHNTSAMDLKMAGKRLWIAVDFIERIAAMDHPLAAEAKVTLASMENEDGSYPQAR